MEQDAILKLSELFVMVLSEGMNHQGLDLQQVEEQILRFAYHLAGQLEEEVIAGLEEPAQEPTCPATPTRRELVLRASACSPYRPLATEVILNAWGERGGVPRALQYIQCGSKGGRRA